MSRLVAFAFPLLVESVVRLKQGATIPATDLTAMSSYFRRTSVKRNGLRCKASRRELLR
jgi:hypothetical protein